MMKYNRGVIGLGLWSNPKPDNGYTTVSQLKSFKKRAKKGDIIFLYESGIGFIAYGIYTGEIFAPQFKSERAPGWSPQERQEHIGIVKWKKIATPFKTGHGPKTLFKIKNIQPFLNKISLEHE